MSLPSRERGLKLSHAFVDFVVFAVAPFAGAWIETDMWSRISLQCQSLPSRERGLKPALLCIRRDPGMSLPSRERGLKLAFLSPG